MLQRGDGYLRNLVERLREFLLVPVSEQTHTGGGRWAMGGGRWAVGDGRWAMGGDSAGGT